MGGSKKRGQAPGPWRGVPRKGYKNEGRAPTIGRGEFWSVTPKVWGNFTTFWGKLQNPCGRGWIVGEPPPPNGFGGKRFGGEKIGGGHTTKVFPTKQNKRGGV